MRAAYPARDWYLERWGEGRAACPAAWILQLVEAGPSRSYWMSQSRHIYLRGVRAFRRGEAEVPSKAVLLPAISKGTHYDESQKGPRIEVTQ